MAKTTIEFSEDASGLLEELSNTLRSSKAEVLRNALSLYGFLVRELKGVKENDLGIVEGGNVVRKIIVVPGISYTGRAEPERVAAAKAAAKLAT